jgi:hypothetical protein
VDQEKIWKRTPAGLLIPSGISTSVWARRSWKLENLCELADDITRIYSTSGVKMSPKCDLYQLIKNARQVATRWIREKLVAQQALFNALHFTRIAEAVLQLSGKETSISHLRALTKGKLNFFHRGRSVAKDFFWEIELWSTLNKKVPGARLKEPPDIVVEHEGKVFGIACKKIYSSANLETVLSQAVGQVEGVFDLGVVALNLDELLPAGCLLKSNSANSMKRELSTQNNSFLIQNDRYFRNYLSTGRLCGAIVSTSTVVDIPSESPRFGNASKSTVWTIDNGASDSSRRLKRLFAVIQSL